MNFERSLIKNLQNPTEFEDAFAYKEYLQEVLSLKVYKENLQDLFSMKYDFEEIQELAKVLDQLLDLEEKYSHAVDDYNLLLSEMDEFNESWKNAVKNREVHMKTILSRTFPKRVQTMVQTLSNIKEYIQNFRCKEEVKVVMIAGESHLLVHKSNVNDKNYNLTLFHQEAQKHKSAFFLLTECVNDHLRI